MTLIITILLIIVLAAFEIARKAKLPIDAFRVCVFLYCWLYFIIPELLPLSYDCYPFCNGVPWLPRVISIAGLSAMIFGYFLSSGLPIFKTVPRIRASDKAEFRFILLVLLFSVVVLYIYASSYGGFLNALKYGALQRYTSAQVIDVKGSAVLTHFVGVAFIIMVVAQYKLYKASKYRNKYIVILVCAVAVILLYSIIHGSRGSIFNMAMIVLFIHFNIRGLKIKPKEFVAIIMVFVFGVLLVAYGKKGIGATASIFRGEEISTAFSSVESKEAEYIYGRIISEFSHQTKSIGVLLDHDIDYNLMEHFFVAPIHLIPTRLLGLSVDKPFRITETNTYLLTGKSAGGIPPGLIASFWYGGGLIGVLAGFMLFGGVIGWLQRQCYSVVKTYPGAMPIVLYIFFRIGWLISNGDPSVSLKHNFHIFVFLMLLVMYYLVRRIRINLKFSVKSASKP